MSVIKGLAHIGLFIRDIERSKKFYTEVLGFEIVSGTENPDGTRVAMARKGDCMVEIVQLPGYENYADGYVNHFAMLVDDIMEAKKDLEAKGVVFESEEPNYMEVLGGVKFLMFRGPDGEHLEIDEMCVKG